MTGWSAVTLIGASVFNAVFYGIIFLAQAGILCYLYIKWDEMPVRSRWGITAAGH
jgi:hypothetical protein